LILNPYEHTIPYTQHPTPIHNTTTSDYRHYTNIRKGIIKMIIQRGKKISYDPEAPTPQGKNILSQR